MKSEWKLDNKNCKIVMYLIWFFRCFWRFHSKKCMLDIHNLKMTIWKWILSFSFFFISAVKLFARSTAPTFAWAVLYSISKNNCLISLIILLIWTKIVFPMFFHCFGENKLKWKHKSDFFQLFPTRKISHFQCAVILSESSTYEVFFSKSTHFTL